jgi:hypothetical protein
MKIYEDTSEFHVHGNILGIRKNPSEMHWKCMEMHGKAIKIHEDTWEYIGGP